MRQRVVTLVLAVAVAFALLALVPRLRSLRLPGYHQGYEPVQPIAYSHRLHAGELQMDCRYCHAGADESRHAGIPPAGTCMSCHRLIKATRAQVRAEEGAAEEEGREPRPVVSPELAKLYDALALDPATMTPDPEKTPRPVEWLRVTRVPDFVWFDHRPHVAAGVACQSCHGPVETMERVRQVESISMGWCLTCHRNPDAALPVGAAIAAASTDCAACHF
ncbi:MAG TPA: cytochrome c3 family protein [Thermoanaerobaculia bacterium]